MIDYIDEIVVAYDKVLKDLSDGFNAVTKKKNVGKTSTSPDDLFIVDKVTEKLREEGATAFYNLVAKMLYVSKHPRPDISTAIAFLITSVRAPDIDDWRKLSHLMEHQRVDRFCPLILSANGSRVLMWLLLLLCTPICAATLVED
jgi:hypothetical protein